MINSNIYPNTSPQQISPYRLQNPNHRGFQSPQVVVSQIIQSPSPHEIIQQYDNYDQQQQEDTKIDKDYIVNLRKLYFMMLIPIIISIILNLFRFEFIESTLTNHPILTFFVILLFIMMPIVAITIESESASILIYLLFCIFMYLTSTWLTGKYGIHFSMMVLFMIGGQIFSQFLSVLQATVALYFHQQSIYVLATGMIVFQIFIVYTDVDFVKMIIILIAGILFGFLLICSTQIKLMILKSGNYFNLSVKAYFGVQDNLLYLNQLILNGIEEFNKVDE